MRIILLFLVLVSTTTFSQEKSFFLHGGLAKRGVPISLSDKNFTVFEKPIFDDVHYRATNFTLDIRKSLLKNKLDIQASGYGRYGHNHFQRDVDLIQERSIKKFRADLFLDFIYNKKLKKVKKTFGYYLVPGLVT